MSDRLTWLVRDSLGTPWAGATLTCTVYDRLGNVRSRPTPTNLGGGQFGVFPTEGDTALGVIAFIDAGALAQTRYFIGVSSDGPLDAFLLTDGSTGALWGGGPPTLGSYHDDSGADIQPHPPITQPLAYIAVLQPVGTEDANYRVDAPNGASLDHDQGAFIQPADALQTFGVTVSSIRRHHFANQSDFSSSSNPTDATVAEMIDDCAGELAGRLTELEIDPSSSAITVGSAPYVQLRNCLRKMVAVRILTDATNQDPPLLARWEKELEAFWTRLEEKGPSALGNESLSSSASEPEGPTTHLDELGIDVGDPATDASDAIPPFRKSDEL